MTKPDVLPCPFCGAVPDVRKALNGDAWAVICANFDEKNGCAIMPRTAWFLTNDEQDGKAVAIKTWNKRPE